MFWHDNRSLFLTVQSIPIIFSLLKPKPDQTGCDSIQTNRVTQIYLRKQTLPLKEKIPSFSPTELGKIEETIEEMEIVHSKNHNRPN